MEWCKYFSSPISILSIITSQFLWFNKNFKIDGKCIYFDEFSINGLNFIENLFKSSENLKMWVKIKEDFHLLEYKKLQQMQLINALGTSWKKSIKEENANLITLSIYDHHIIKNNRIFSLNKLSSRELYNMQIIKTIEKPTSQSSEGHYVTKKFFIRFRLLGAIFLFVFIP